MKTIKSILLFFLFLIIPFNIYAKEFKTNYKVQYFLSDNLDSINSEVKYAINITNLNEGYYVSKFTLSFPDTFLIENISAQDDIGSINPIVTNKDNTITIELVFNNPKTTIGSQNNFYLTFNQKNLFNINGNIWEVILPVVKKDNDETYQVDVILPENSSKKISISKPYPNSIINNQISWTNPITKTIYAIFGENQIYDLKLDYYLYNPKLISGYFDIAFPPDMPYQKIYLQSIKPEPNKTFTDSDGNFIGRYILKPREKINVKYLGLIEISSKSREDVRKLDISKLPLQKDYLLNEDIYWKIDNPTKYKDLKDAYGIYNYLTSTFTYDYTRISKNIKRLGAQFALKNPNMAVCTEFSDSFVTLAREKGFYSREIQGYGFSNSSELRPLSLSSDILHSWPQYFDTNKNLWISIDPTWENTSGIDYFTSFDLNHIAFAIHGRSPKEPYPAGMYKFNNTKDISVIPTKLVPKENIKLNISSNIPKAIAKNKKFKGKLEIKNQSNIFLYSIPISLKSNNLNTNLVLNEIDQLAPFEIKTIDFSINPSSSKINNTEISFLINKTFNYTKNIKLIDWTIWYIVGVFLLLILIFIFIVKKIRQHKI